MAKENRGGKRTGSGRKKLPVNKRKIMVHTFEEAGVVKKVGGLAKAKSLISNALNEAAKIV